MKSITEFFNRMHDVDFQYVVLRNWEGLPDTVELGPHGDLDILVYDIDHWVELFPEAERVYDSPRVQFKQPIGDSFIQIDVRYVGDGYYPLNFERSMLSSRVYNENGFFTPDNTHHKLGLVYHCVHHKGSNTYPDILGNASIPELLEALQDIGVGWSQPIDPSVGVYNSYLQGATSTVRKEDGKIIKKQVSYKDYSLIENEARILKRLNSKHFPKLLSSDEEELEVEDCGEHLTVYNIPKNWKKQLVEIVKELQKNNVCHNDIKIDNLMVKNKTIKLIDFGWASLKGENIDHYPDCLGQPNRASWGPDDNYAAKAVMRQLQYIINEHKEGDKNE